MAADFKTGTSLAAKVLASIQLASGDNTVYTVPALSAVKIATAVLCNTTSSAVVVSVSVVPSGGTVNGTHKVVADYSLAAKDSTTLPELVGSMLDAGAYISVNAGTATAVNCILTGVVSS
jgi:hypothetical protein